MRPKWLLVSRDKSAQKYPRGYREIWEGGFGYGESEYEVSFGLAPRMGSYSLPILIPQNRLALCSGPGIRNGVHIRIAPKYAVCKSKTLGHGAYTDAEIQGRWSSLHFCLTFKGTNFIFDLSGQKQCIFHHLETIDLLSLSAYAPGTQVSIYRPKFCRKL